MSHRGPQRRCARCRFWKYNPEERAPADWNRPNEKMGLCEHPAVAHEPRRLKLFGAGGCCALFTVRETTS